MDAQKASKILQKTIKNPKMEFCIADASIQSGLSFQDAKIGLLAAIVEFQGELIPTETGNLLFRFPNGFIKPWRPVKLGFLLWSKTINAFVGIVKFLARTWITITITTYAIVFLIIIISVSIMHKSDKNHRTHSSNSSNEFSIITLLLKIVTDSLFWNFHPFSPFRKDYININKQTKFKKNVNKISFYEKVNKFFFGPDESVKDPLENKRIILKEIRLLNGRISSLDILRITGMSRQEIDITLTSLLLEYDGDITVSNNGVIIYLFPELRKTALETNLNLNENSILRWMEPKKMKPLTGNSIDSNIAIIAINSLNLFMSTVAIENHWTLDNVRLIFTGAIKNTILISNEPVLLLGWIPFIFSLFLFCIPIVRFAVIRPLNNINIKHANSKNAVIWTILTNLKKDHISESSLIDAWKKSSNSKPNMKYILHEIIQLGGELSIDEITGERNYVFKDLQFEIKALKKERQLANMKEKEIGNKINIYDI